MHSARTNLAKVDLSTAQLVDSFIIVNIDCLNRGLCPSKLYWTFIGFQAKVLFRRSYCKCLVHIVHVLTIHIIPHILDYPVQNFPGGAGWVSQGVTENTNDYKLQTKQTKQINNNKWLQTADYRL